MKERQLVQQRGGILWDIRAENRQKWNPVFVRHRNREYWDALPHQVSSFLCWFIQFSMHIEAIIDYENYTKNVWNAHQKSPESPKATNGMLKTVFTDVEKQWKKWEGELPQATMQLGVCSRLYSFLCPATENKKQCHPVVFVEETEIETDNVTKCLFN